MHKRTVCTINHAPPKKDCLSDKKQANKLHKKQRSGMP